MTDPSACAHHFNRFCIQEPPDEVTPLRDGWTEAYAVHTVQPHETLRSIAERFARSGRVPEGFDWRQLALFNLGVNRPAHINWCLCDVFGFDPAVNITEDKRNYVFKGDGSEELWIPLRPGAPGGGVTALAERNTVVVPRPEVGSVAGPSLVTQGIDSVFRVTGYTVPQNRVTQASRDAVRWKIKDVAAGNETDSAETGEEVRLSFTGLGKQYRVYPYLQAKRELVRCEPRVIRVELQHEIKMADVTDGRILPADPLNKIHNPAAIVIGASNATRCARVRLTKIEPNTFHMAPNDDGFKWEVENVAGEAAFRRVGAATRNTGIGCELYGLHPGEVIVKGRCAHAVDPCVQVRMKVVQERSLPFRANFLSRRHWFFWSRGTAATPLKVHDVIAIANVHLWQMGVRLVPDPDATTYKVGSEDIAAMDGRPGFFEVEHVPSEYVENIQDADTEAACRINSRSGVVNFNMVISLDGDTWGLGPCCPHNVHSSSLTGMDETGTNQTSQVFDSPANRTSAEGRAGILLMDPTFREADSDTKIGAVIAHELGHNLAMWHRGVNPQPHDAGDGLPVSNWNLMYAFVNRWDGGVSRQDTQTDIDLVQLAICRGSSLLPGAPGNLVLAPDKNELRGAKNSVQEVKFTARRGATAVPNTRFHVWTYPFNTNIIGIAGGTLPASGISADGKPTFRVRLRGNAGQRAWLIVKAVENDDLVTEVITCVIE